MTKLLEEAIEAVWKLPPEQQDAVAAILLGEIASEERWNEAFAESQDVLTALGKQALEEHAAGRTTPMNRVGDFKGH